MDRLMPILLAVLVILIIAMDHTFANHGYHFRLTNPENHRVELVTEFSTFDDCQSGRDIAQYFNYYATCGGSDD